MKLEVLKATAKTFAKKFGVVFAVILTLHILILLGLSYVQMEWRVISGLDFTEWGTIWRAVSLVPYFILPLGVASIQTFRHYKPRVEQL